MAEEGLQSPHRGLPYIHVTGTHGKGSTVALLQAALINAGVKTGCFTSPHLRHPKDCIKIEGVEISLYDWARLSVQVRRAAHPIRLSSFEVQCLVALCCFREQAVKAAILEVGMGGLNDATNLMDGRWQLAAILGPVGLDHQEWLGPTLSDICEQKLGILRPSKPLILAPQRPEILPLIQARASQLACPVIAVKSPYAGDVPLAGEHQRWNAAVAAACLSLLSVPVNFEGAVWPGRLSHMEWNGLSILCDGAHTPEAARTVRPYFELHRQKAQFTWIVGHSGKRNVKAFVDALPIAPTDSVIFCGFSQPLGMDWIKAQRIGGGIWAENIQEALESVPHRHVIVTGSLYLISDLYRLLIR